MSAERANQLVEAGVWLQATGDVEGARRLFEQALKLDPQNARARQFLSNEPPPPRPTPAYGSNPFQRVTDPLPYDPPAEEETLPPGIPRSIELDVSWADVVDGSQSWSPQGSDSRLADDADSAWDTESSSGIELATPGFDKSDPMALIRDQTQPTAPPTGAGSRVDEEIDTLLSGAEDLLELDDHSGAMELIVKAERLRPTDPRIRELKARSEHTLELMYESKLGPLEKRPRVVLKEDEIIWLNLDHRAGFVLAQIDGTVTYDDVFAVSGMSRLDTARILAQLLDEGVIVPS